MLEGRFVRIAWAKQLPPGTMTEGARMDRIRFSILLYRYFFYGWLFRDAGHGTDAERSAASRYNRYQARCLPTYMRRWSVAGVLLFSVAWFFESVVGSPTLSVLFYVASVLAVPFNAVTSLCWCFLRFPLHSS